MCLSSRFILFLALSVDSFFCQFNPWNPHKPMQAIWVTISSLEMRERGKFSHRWSSSYALIHASTNLARCRSLSPSFSYFLILFVASYVLSIFALIAISMCCKNNEIHQGYRVMTCLRSLIKMRRQHTKSFFSLPLSVSSYSQPLSYSRHHVDPFFSSPLSTSRDKRWVNEKKEAKESHFSPSSSYDLCFLHFFLFLSPRLPHPRDHCGSASSFLDWERETISCCYSFSSSLHWKLPDLFHCV